MINLIGSAKTVQQLIDNQTGVEFQNSTMMILRVMGTTAAAPTSYYSGYIQIRYSDIQSLGTPESLAESFTELFEETFRFAIGYDAAVDKITFGISPEGYLTISGNNPDIKVGAYSPVFGEGSEFINPGDIGKILGFEQVPNNGLLDCSYSGAGELWTYVNLNIDEELHIFVPTPEGDIQKASIVLQGTAEDDTKRDYAKFLDGISTSLNMIGLTVETSVDNVPGKGNLPGFHLTNKDSSCIVIKMQVTRDSDAESGFITTVDGQKVDQDPRTKWPLPDTNEFLNINIGRTTSPTVNPKKSYVRFRNKDGSKHHRIELIPTNEGTVVSRDGESLEFTETKEGYGFCLAPDLCFETGVELSITVSTAFKTNDDVSTIYVRDKRRNEQIASIPTYGGLTQEQLAQELKTALESTGLTVKTETVDETYLKLDLVNYSSGNITLELIFPYGDLIPENAITVEGNANTTVGSKNYMYANYAVGFCIAPSEKPQIEISCDGATSTTGFVTLDGRFDVYIDDMETPTHTNISAEELYDIYKDGHNGLQIETEGSGIPIGCEGAADYIIVGPLTDGGFYDVTVNDQVVPSSGRMFRDGGFLSALEEYGIKLTPLDVSNVEQSPSEGTTDRYYDAERGSFVNTTDEYKRISIKATDATFVTNNWSPDANQSFYYDEPTQTAHFCLAPGVIEFSPFSCDGATTSAVTGGFWNTWEVHLNGEKLTIPSYEVAGGYNIEGWYNEINQVLEQHNIVVKYDGELKTIFTNHNPEEVRLEFFSINGDPRNPDSKGTIKSNPDNANPTLFIDSPEHFGFCLAAGTPRTDKITLDPGEGAHYLVGYNTSNDSNGTAKQLWYVTRDGVTQDMINHDIPDDGNINAIHLDIPPSNGNDCHDFVGIAESELDEDTGWVIYRYSITNQGTTTAIVEVDTSDDTVYRVGLVKVIVLV